MPPRWKQWLKEWSILAALVAVMLFSTRLKM